MSAMPCWICGDSFHVSDARVIAAADSDRLWDPTLWECPQCEHNQMQPAMVCGSPLFDAASPACASCSQPVP